MAELVDPIILRSAGRALGLWFGIYLLIMHVFIVWNWSADPGVPHDMEPLPPVVDADNPWYESPEYQENLERLEKTIQDIERELFSAQTLSKKYKSLVRKLENAIQVDNEPPQLESDQFVLFRDAKKRQRRHPGRHNLHDPNRLKDLLRVQNLQQTYPLDTAVRQAFRLAQSDIQKNIQMAKDLDWSNLRKILVDELELPDRTAVSDPAHSNETECRVQDPYVDAMRTNDVQIYVQRIREELSQQSQQEGLPVLLPETAHRLESLRDRMSKQVEEMRAEIEDELKASLQAQTEKTAETTGQCMQSHQVIPWLEAGLDSIYRGRGIREGLRRAFQQDHAIDTSGIIIDADLHGDEQGDDPAEKTGPRSLRQLLNTPLITEVVPKLINAGIDTVSGYHDPLDQHLDGIEADDLGRAAVEKLLQSAGSVQVPKIPENYRKQQKEAGVLSNK